MPLTRIAPAKVNLYLHVTAKREDGYHLLDSLFTFCALGDQVSAQKSDDLSLTIDGPFGAALSSEPDNLILQAARALATAAGVEAKAALHLEKNLPIAAGIGGGSSDAAAALLVLNELWKLNWPLGDLQALALPLGADIPACLEMRPVLVSGIGEVIKPSPTLPDCALLLINPLVQTPTGPIFKALNGNYSVPHPMEQTCRDFGDFAKALGQRHNDLAGPARNLCPEVSQVLIALESVESCHLARMSGSGATCFGLFETKAQAQKAADQIRATQPDWWYGVTTLLS